MSVTIKDIAKAAGFSHITVSRALNNNDNVRPETRDKVIEVASRMGYTPNMNARSLVLKRSFTIGLFFSSITRGTSPEVFYELVEKVNRDVDKDYNIVVKGIDSLTNVNKLAHTNYDGILLFSQSSRDAGFIEEVIARKIPLVVINRRVEDVDNISFNDEAGAYLILKELLEHGHRRIGFLMGAATSTATQRRMEGYRKALEEVGLTMDESDVSNGEITYDFGYSVTKALLIQRNGMTAVCCMNDDIAIGAMKAVKESGLSVPGDISVCGYDGTKVAAMLEPALSTVRRPVTRAAEMALEILFQRIGSKEVDRAVVSLEPELIRGKSVGDAN